MRIGIQTWGTHGDVRPFLALAEGLRRAGHQVHLVVTSVDDSDYTGCADELDITVSMVASPVISKDRYLDDGKRIFTEKNPLKQAGMILSEALVPAEQAMYDAARQLCRDNDVVVGHFFAYPVQVAAEETASPFVSVWLNQSGIPTRFAPPEGMPQFGVMGNRFFWWLLRKLLNRYLLPHVNGLRKKIGLPAAGDLIHETWAAAPLNLIAVSTALCPKQTDWPDSFHICGFLNRPNLANEGRLTGEMEAFLRDGSPPVFFTFGSMLKDERQAQLETLALFSQAAGKAGCRAIIQLPGWESLRVKPAADTFFVDRAPHGLIFPRCAAVVHHGGAGTTQAATSAGVASVVVAHIAEQVHWGNQLNRLGIAPKVLSRVNADPERLGRRIAEVLQSPSMQQSAKGVAAELNRENGVANAVELIERYCSVQ